MSAFNLQTATINDIAGFFEIDRDLAKVVSSSDCKSFQELQAVPGLELAVIYKASEKCSIVYESAATCKSENSATQTSYSSLESRFDKLEALLYQVLGQKNMDMVPSQTVSCNTLENNAGKTASQDVAISGMSAREAMPHNSDVSQVVIPPQTDTGKNLELFAQLASVLQSNGTGCSNPARALQEKVSSNAANEAAMQATQNLQANLCSGSTGQDTVQPAVCKGSKAENFQNASLNAGISNYRSQFADQSRQNSTSGSSNNHFKHEYAAVDQLMATKCVDGIYAGNKPQIAIPTAPQPPLSCLPYTGKPPMGGGTSSPFLYNNGPGTSNGTGPNNSTNWVKKMSLLPKFDGKGWQAFITIFERQMARYSLTDSLKLELLESKLTGLAFDFYGNLSRNIQTYDELRGILHDRFGSRITPQLRRNELFSMKQNADESLVEFGGRVAFVASEGYPDLSHCNRSELEIHAFLHGCVDQTLAERVMLIEHSTLGAALSAMVRAEQNAKAFHKPSKIVRAVHFDEQSNNGTPQMEADIEIIKNSVTDIMRNVSGLRNDSQTRNMDRNRSPAYKSDVRYSSPYRSQENNRTSGQWQQNSAGGSHSFNRGRTSSREVTDHSNRKQSPGRFQFREQSPGRSHHYTSREQSPGRFHYREQSPGRSNYDNRGYASGQFRQYDRKQSPEHFRYSNYTGQNRGRETSRFTRQNSPGRDIRAVSPSPATEEEITPDLPPEISDDGMDNLYAHPLN